MQKFLNKVIHKKKKEHLIEAEEGDSNEVIVPWCFERIPNSFKAWLRSNLTERADPTWNMGDESTVESAVENVEYFLRNPKMTKNDKGEKIVNILRAMGVKRADEFLKQIYQQLEVYSFDYESPRQSHRKQKQLQKESISNSPVITRKRSQSVY